MKYFLTVCAFGLFSLQTSAHALSLQANSQYNLTGHVLSTFEIQGLGTYYFQFDQTGLVNTGNLNNGLFDSITLQSVINSTHAYSWDTGANKWETTTHNLGGSTHATYNNVSYSNSLAAAVQGVNSSKGDVNVAGTFGGYTIATGGANNMQLNYMDYTAPTPVGRWDVFDGLFSSNVLGMTIQPTGDGINAYIDSWLAGTGTLLINNQLYNVLFCVDYHSTISYAGGTEIPEPATMGLLFSGLLGGVAARRKRAQQAA